MWLAETEAGFVVRPGGDRRDERALARDLLALLRRSCIPFVVGGARDSDILTLGPLSREHRADVRAWWLVRQRGAAQQDQ